MWCGGRDGEVFKFGGDNDFIEGGLAGDGFGHGFFERGFVDVKAAGGVALRVEVNEEGVFVEFR